MAKSENDRAEIITAKWKTRLDAEERYFGTIELDEDCRLRFPILDSVLDIPYGTTILWGRASDLQRCTAVTLPFGPHGSVHSNGDRSFRSDGAVSRLIIGQTYIPDPTAAFVTEIHFIPRPNRNLHIRQVHELIQPRKDIAEIKFTPSCEPEKTTFATAHFAFFEPERDAVLDAEFQSGEIGIHAWIGGASSPEFETLSIQSHISFTIRFKTPRDVESALDETNKLCTFLSFLTHQYIYPTEFGLAAAGEEHHFRLICRAFRKPVLRENTWVRNTLIVPDAEPIKFRDVLAMWYTNNEDALRGRYLYRYSFEDPNNFSTDRFLAVFQAVEGRISKAGHQFLSKEELEKIEKVLQQALPDVPKLDALIGKIKSSNSESPRVILKSELPRLFAAARIEARFDVDEFVERIYLRRNKSSHGGSHLDHEPIQALLNDTLLLTAIYLVIECEYLGLEPRDALTKFQSSMWHDLPFRASYGSN